MLESIEEITEQASIWQKSTAQNKNRHMHRYLVTIKNYNALFNSRQELSKNSDTVKYLFNKKIAFMI